MSDEHNSPEKQNRNQDETPRPIEGMVDEFRRKFLILISLGAGAFATTAVSVPLLSFLLAPLFRRMPPVWRPVGKLDDFKIGDTVEVSFQDSSPLVWGGNAAKCAAWLRRDNQSSFTAFSVDCTHLGCPVRWEPQAEMFFCPCHGGVYYKNGDVAAGPPPDPLQQYPVRVNDNVVEVQWKVLPVVADCGCGPAGPSSNPRAMG